MTVTNDILFGTVVIALPIIVVMIFLCSCMCFCCFMCTFCCIMYFRCCGERCLGCLGFPWCFDFEKCCDPCFLLTCCGLCSCLCPCGHPGDNMQKRMNKLRKRAKIHSERYQEGFEDEGELMNVHTPPGPNLLDPYTKVSHIVENLCLVPEVSPLEKGHHHQNLDNNNNNNNQQTRIIMSVSSASPPFGFESHPGGQREPLIVLEGTDINNNNNSNNNSPSGKLMIQHEIQTPNKMISLPENEEAVIRVDTSSQDESEEEEKEEKQLEEEQTPVEDIEVEEVVSDNRTAIEKGDVEEEVVRAKKKPYDDNAPETPVQALCENVQKMVFDGLPIQIQDEEEVTDEEERERRKRRREEEFDIMVSPGD